MFIPNNAKTSKFTMARLLKYLLYLVAIVALVAAGFMAYLAWFQAPFYFPKPTGGHAIGIKTYHWVDAGRQETLHNDPTHPNRELMVNIWYPAQGTLAKKPTTPYTPYLVNHFKKNHAFDVSVHLPHRPVYSYSQPEAPLAIDTPRYPVIIFSHGSGCSRDYNTAQCEELASNGYVVVGIGHTYNSRVVQFPDGRIADGLKAIEERWKNKTLAGKLKQLDQEIETWIADINFVLNHLEQLANDKASLLYQRIDQENIGIFGHSMGGGAAAQACRRNTRVKAGVALDGFLFGPDAQKNFDKPFMFMLAGDGIKTFERPWTQDDWKKFGVSSPEDEAVFKSYYLPATAQLAQALGRNGYTVVVKNAGHLDFTDVVFLQYASPFWRILMASGMTDGALGLGTIDCFKTTELVNAYLVNFFNKYLKGQPSKLFDGNRKQYTEIEEKLRVNK